MRKWHPLLDKMLLSYFVIALAVLMFSSGAALALASLSGKKVPLSKTFVKIFLFLNNRPRTKLHFVWSAYYKEKGTTIYKPESVYPGITLIASFWKDKQVKDPAEDWNLYIRLIDFNGDMLHQWRCDLLSVWPKPIHDDILGKTEHDKKHTSIHGTLLLPNGDIIFNFSLHSLVRMNAKGEVIWKLPYRTHHSIFLDENNKLWVCGYKWETDSIPKYLGLKPPFRKDTVLKISMDGKIEREISLLEVIYNSGYQSLIRTRTDDILHANDIEVLSTDKAKNFPLFEAGDIIVSLRDINAIIVIDNKTEKIKWSMTHPFIAQHDPDFTDDGHIILFDNNLDRSGPESEYGGSRILKINPLTKTAAVAYGGNSKEYFFTKTAGQQQLLPNGNLLITESKRGRVFEINSKGEIVWDWVINRWNKSKIAEVLEGSRYPRAYADFTIKHNTGGH